MIRRFIVAVAVLVGAGAILSAQRSATLFEYDRAKPFGIAEAKASVRDGVLITDFTYERVAGGRRAGTLVEPAGPARRLRPAVLFVHWYEPPKPTSNRTEFLPDALALARSGVVSLLVDTMWTDPNWFEHRDPASDFGHSVEQVKELRRALDMLASRPGVDAGRLHYVGHDFGAMYGAIVAGLDARRLKAFVFMAGTRSFSDWFLLWPKRDEVARAGVVSLLEPLDPTRFLAMPDRLPMLLQFAARDKFVTKAAAEALVACVRSPKDVRWYDAEHELNEAARDERVAWLLQRITRP